MKSKFRLSVVLFCSVISTASQASDYANPIFGYTHLLPSPFTLPAGRLAFGTDIALGVTDFLQVGTNIVRDIYKVYNANAKVSLVDYEQFAAAVTLGFQSYNYKDIYAGNPDLHVTSWRPGLVTAFAVFPQLAVFVGGNLNYTNASLVTDGIETSGFVQGADVEADISWAYNPPSKKRRISNALSAGVTYDITYKIYGIGISHHWPGFHLGIHYYPNASEYKVLPIIAGGGTVDL